MRQFDLFDNPSVRSRAFVPFVVVLQSHYLSAMPTVVVAPLIRDDGRSAYTDVSARVAVNGETFIVSAAELAAVEARLLGKPIGSLLSEEDAIRSALQKVFTGF